MRKLMVMFLVLIVAILPIAAFAANSGVVDWKKGVVQVVGVGFPPNNISNPAQATYAARRVAMLDAYRNMLETLNGVQVDAETSLNDLMMNESIKVKVSGLVKGAYIVDEQQMPDGSYRIIMEVKLFGENSVAQAVIPSMASNMGQPLPEPTQTLAATNIYTGVVIDARGLNLDRCMSPVIKDDKGRVVYGNKNLNIDQITKYGAVDYATDEDMNDVNYGKSRAGSNPLIIKATSLSEFNRNVVISEADANKMLVENKATNFLGKTNVVFIQ
jgi:hypothetical protein